MITTTADLSGSQDLHYFVDEYRRLYPEDVLDITEPVGNTLDVAGVVWKLAAAGRHEMLIFRNVSGIPYPVVTNVFACRRRIARILGTDPAHLHDVFQARAKKMVEPVEIEEGPVLDRTIEGDEIDLRDFLC